jgi:D-ribulokinase
MYVMGIDLGTSGARVVVCNAQGEVAVLAAHRLDNAEVDGLPAGWHEQRAEAWWPALVLAIREALSKLEAKGLSSSRIVALSVTSTSGTVLPLDSSNHPLRPALMYNDGRAMKESSDLNEMSSIFAARMGRGFAPSFALPKMLWVRRREPDIFKRAERWVHATDFIVGKLTGEYGISDHSTALKTGFDLIDLEWPAFIESTAGVPLSTLPRVVQPGAVIANISPVCAQDTGLSTQTVVCAGMTDSSTALLATGAARPGDWNTTIGTTLTIKGISEALIRDPSGVVYCHLHPMGWWLPGAASNVGGESLEVRFKDRDFGGLDAQAEARGPSSVVVYPLVRRGERFPFNQPNAEGFTLGEPADEIDLYRGYLEGVGLTERLAYATLENLGARIGDRLYVAGGAVHSKTWLQIRADILCKTLLRPAIPESAMGAAILAASFTLFSNAAEAGRHMVKLDEVVEPRSDRTEIYGEKYGRFVEACRERGYLS